MRSSQYWKKSHARRKATPQHSISRLDYEVTSLAPPTRFMSGYRSEISTPSNMKLNGCERYYRLSLPLTNQTKTGSLLIIFFRERSSRSWLTGYHHEYGGLIMIFRKSGPSARPLSTNSTCLSPSDGCHCCHIPSCHCFVCVHHASLPLTFLPVWMMTKVQMFTRVSWLSFQRVGLLSMV